MTGNNKTDRHFSCGAHEKAGESLQWTGQPASVRRIVMALFAVCALLLAIDVWIHKHGPFAIEHLWGFYGILSFIGCAFFVLAARVMRALLLRGEHYYDR